MHILKCLNSMFFCSHPGLICANKGPDARHRSVIEIIRVTVTYTIVTAPSCLEGSTTLRVISYPNSSGTNTVVISFQLKRIWNKELE